MLILLIAFFPLKIWREAVLAWKDVVYLDKYDQGAGNKKGRIRMAVIMPGGRSPTSLSDARDNSVWRSDATLLNAAVASQVAWDKIKREEYDELSVPGGVFRLALANRVDDVPVTYCVLLLVAGWRLYSAVPTVTDRRRMRPRHSSYYIKILLLGLALGVVPQFAHLTGDYGAIHGTFFTRWDLPHIAITQWVDGLLYVYLGFLAAVFVLDYDYISRRYLRGLRRGRDTAERASRAVFSWVPAAVLMFSAFGGIKTIAVLELFSLNYNPDNLLYTLFVLAPPGCICYLLIRRYYQFIDVRYRIGDFSPTLEIRARPAKPSEHAASPPLPR